jgi:ribonuclease BN (tRNA processing enzyme)/ActR/RegA family two-component response regulator
MKKEALLILVADAEKKVHDLFKELKKEIKGLEIFHALNSDEAIQIFSQHPIDLAFIDLYLFPVHGLEILKKIKSIIPQADVVITSYEPMIQNFRACLTHGALDFLPKPLTVDILKEVLQGREEKVYKPHVFVPPKLSHHPFILKEHSKNTYMKFWGTRGSHSVSGVEYLRFGGNTACLEIRCGEHLVIIDAGTGLTNLGQELLKEPEQTHIELLIGHTHLDHVAGLPGFGPLHDPKFTVTIRAPINFYKNTKELLRDMLTHAFFPVDLEEIRASLKFKELITRSPFEIGPLKIDCHYTYHPGTTLGFKIHIGDLKIGYITDNEALMGYLGDPKQITLDHPLLAPHLDFIDFFKEVDILVHEAQYNPKTYVDKVGWGHSSIYNAAVLVKYINPKIWIITHHDPEDNDEMIQKKHEIILEACHYLEIPAGINIAFDGMKINF